MLVAVADTHAALWYLSPDKRLSVTAKTFIENAAADNNYIGISSITLVEIVYLIEKGRIPAESLTRLARELDSPRRVFREFPLDLAIARTLARVGSVPDMPDRIIGATALHLGVPIISRDGRIQVSDLNTIW
jgi:PIN domain nuclease of toxin-antitoxin system